MVRFVACGKLNSTDGDGLSIPLILNKSGIISGDVIVTSEFVKDGKFNFPIEIKEVTGFVDCYDIGLISLEGAPEKVGGSFNCNHNYLVSLKGCPKFVGGWFYCSENKLTTLQGCPKFVGGDFVCEDNPRKFTEEEVRAVCRVKGKVYV